MDEINLDKKLKNDIFSANTHIALSALKVIKDRGNKSYLPILFDLLLSFPEKELEMEIRDILGTVKQKESVPVFITALKKEKYNPIRKMILAACWQNGLDFKEHLPFFTEIVIKENWETGFEAFTIIENLKELPDPETIEKTKTIINNTIENTGDKKDTFCKKSFLEFNNNSFFYIEFYTKNNSVFPVFLVVIASGAQTERNLIPFSNKVLLNPSYAGLFENTSVWTGYQFYTNRDKDVFNEYSLTYDKYSDKLDGGIAFYLRQGLAGDVNINTSEFGFAVSRYFEADKNFFIPSVNLNFEFANKQWYVQFIDKILAKEIEPPSSPGNEFGRFYRIKPKLGFLWDSKKYQAGISAQFPFGSNLANDGIKMDLNNPVFIMHWAKKISGLKKGLVSLPFRAKPEATFLYSKNLILSRLSLNMEEVRYTYSFFIQNNFTENLHGIGGAFGWKLENIRLNFSAGMSFPSVSNQVVFYGEARLGIIIPSVHYFEKKPWAPIKNGFNFTI